MQGKVTTIQYNNFINHNYNKILESDWLSAAMI